MTDLPFGGVPPKVTQEELRARVAARIRQIAKKKGLPLTQVADQAKISKGHLWKALGGESSMTLDLLNRIAAVLEVDPDELVRRYRTPPPSDFGPADE